MNNNKSTRIIAIGVAVFVIGGALLFLLLRNGGSTSNASNPKVASTPIATVPPGSVTFSATPPTTIIQFKIPAGENAVAIPMDYFAGVAGYVRPGDKVNVYAFVNKDCVTKDFPAAVKLIQSNVQVLEVLGAAPAASGTPGSFLLALTPQQAEQILYFQHFGSMYMSLTTNNEPNATTAGVTCTNSL